MNTDMMEESLKSARFLYRLILVICGTTIAFVLSDQRDSSEYSRALEELNELAALRTQLQTYHGEVKASIDKSGGTKDYQEIVEDAANDAKVNISTLTTPVFSSAFPLRYEVPPFNSSLTLLREFFRGNNRASAYVDPDSEVLLPEKEEFREKMKETLTRLHGQQFLAWRCSAQQFSRDLFWQDRDKDPTVVRIVVDYHPTDNPGEIAHLYSRYAVKAYGICPQPEYNMSCMAWVKQQRLTDRLTTTEGETEIWFPRLRRVWSELEAKSLDEAIPYVEDKLSEQTDIVSIVGPFAISETHLQWTVPILICLVIGYLVVHIAHIRRLSSNNLNLDEYPWIPLFPDPLSIALTHGSVFILPVSTTVLLLVPTDLHPALKIAIVGTVVGSASTLSVSLYLLNNAERRSLTLVDFAKGGFVLVAELIAQIRK